jgi:uroporphyrin-III C-methyltransferase / precorrin-2 dehydrogenase / sirohydrochlorin ferrochelatase
VKGKVYLVGAGPGDPELLTLKALRALRSADAVLHDELVSAEILKLVPPTAAVQNVGKRCGRKSTPQDEINTMMITMAAAGFTVVRLKGGDPLIFGRVGEEIESLRRAHIEFEIIPGITAAAGAAAAAKIPLTDRRAASRIVLATGHRKFGRAAVGPISPDATLVLYMPGDDYGFVSTELQKSGLSPKTPCAIVSQASTDMQQVRRTTVQDLAAEVPLPAPALLIVGAVAATAVESANQLHDEIPLMNCWTQL